MTPLAPDVWLADGPPVTAALGFRYPTRMAVIRLADGGLWVWSPVALTDAVRESVTALGPVRHLVAPNALHHLSLAEWQAAFPEAEVHAAPGVAGKQPGVRIDHALTPASPLPEIANVFVPNAIAPEFVFFHEASRTLLVCDLIQHLPPDWYRGWRRTVARLDLMTDARPQVPRKFRLALRGPGGRAALRSLPLLRPERLVIAHGPVSDGAALSAALDWL